MLGGRNVVPLVVIPNTKRGCLCVGIVGNSWHLALWVHHFCLSTTDESPVRQKSFKSSAVGA